MKHTFTLLAFLLFAPLIASPAADQSEQKPNIVFILVDDLGYADLGCQGSDDVRTPRIDSLAGQGIRFTDAYVTAPQCGPSRAGIVTGMNQARFGYLDNKGHSGLPDPDVLPLMPEDHPIGRVSHRVGREMAHRSGDRVSDRTAG